jgi:hypothetical protein
VLVLQNFGSRSRPLWHYAVVFGREGRHYLLRSGVTERQRLASRRFLGTWDRADRWAMVLLPPQAEPPPFLSARAWIDAVAAFESTGGDARSAWRSTTRRWPREPLGQLGLATAELGDGNAADAERRYRLVLELDPASVPAANNLALLVARRGCRREALGLLDRASAAATAGPWLAALADTRREVTDLPAPTAEPADCAAP